MMWQNLLARRNGNNGGGGLLCRAMALTTTPPRANYSMKATDMEVKFEFKEDLHATFSAPWLRHYCQCERCTQPSSGQRLRRPLAFSYGNLQIKDCKQNDQQVEVVTSDDHVNVYPVEYLKTHANKFKLKKQRDKLLPLWKENNKPAVFEFADIKSNKFIRLAWLKAVLEVGVCLVKNVPSELSGLRELVKLTDCSYSHTLYGETFEVVSLPNPINVAYSSEELEPHQDLAYFESPPGIQILHTIEFDDTIEGGNSTFVDAHVAAEILKLEDKIAFDTLCWVPATFQKDHMKRANPAKMFYYRPHIACDNEGEILSVYWAPPFEGPLVCEDSYMQRKYFLAHEKFAKILRQNNKNYSMNFRMVKGDAVVFNNRRMLHGRTAFTGDGKRHLHGCYLEMDDYLNKLRVKLFLNDNELQDWVEPRVGLSSRL